MMSNTQSTYGAFDAKTRFSELLERVAAGEEIMITKHGTPVAKLVPISRPLTDDSRRVAIERMKKLTKRNLLNGDSIQELRIEGRR